MARRTPAWLYPRFLPSCPFSRVRGSVSSSRHLARSVRISRTTRSCTLRDKVYETYPIGAAFDDSPGAVTQIQVSALAIDYSTASNGELVSTPSPFSLPLAVLIWCDLSSPDAQIHRSGSRAGTIVAGGRRRAQL